MLSDEEVDELVSLVHTQYTQCGFKPSDAHQFTILSAFVVSKKSSSTTNSEFSLAPYLKLKPPLKLISLATGSKCLPESRLPAAGDALHDSHAEVLARRGAIRYFYDELCTTVSGELESDWIARRPSGKWCLKEGVQLHMYISTVPCGDASMRFLAAAQDAEMAALKDSTARPAAPPDTAARGRDNYALYGVLRTKPGRADSPRTLSMSCSDKIASWNVLGIQGALAAEIFEPIYASTIVIGDGDGDGVVLLPAVREDCVRALFDRLDGITGLPSAFHLNKPDIHFTSQIFTHSRSQLHAQHPSKAPPTSSNDSLCWIASAIPHLEVVINGSRRGVGAKLRSLDRYRPLLCKASFLKLHRQTLATLERPLPPSSSIHFDLKQAAAEYQLARNMLKGCGGPFAGWIVSGRRWESFDADGVIHDSGLN